MNGSSCGRGVDVDVSEVSLSAMSRGMGQRDEDGTGGLAVGGDELVRLMGQEGIS
jgi:hypothetical protein